MQTFNTLLSNYSNVFLIVISIVVYLLTNLIKKYIPQKFKNLVPLIPFVLGLILVGICLLVFGDFNIVNVFCNGLQTGGLANLIYAILNKVFKNSPDIQKTLQGIIEGITSSEKVKSVVTQIVTAFKNVNTQELYQHIFNIILENCSVTEQECENISGLLLKIINSLTKK